MKEPKRLRWGFKMSLEARQKMSASQKARQEKIKLKRIADQLEKGSKHVADNLHGNDESPRTARGPHSPRRTI